MPDQNNTEHPSLMPAMAAPAASGADPFANLAFCAPFEHPMLGMALVTLDGRWLKVNRALCQMLGYSETDLLTTSLPSVTHAEDVENDLWSLSRLDAGQIDHYVVEKRLFHRTGQTVWALLVVSMIRDPHTNSAYCAIQFEDVTDRKRAEEFLRESEARFRALADSAPVLIWMTGPDDGCEYFNRGWLEFTGRALHQELGDGWAEGLHPEDRKRVLVTCQKARLEHDRFELEFRLRRHDGEYRWLMAAGVPRLNSDGFAGYIGSCLDITDRKQSQIELQRLLTASDEAQAQLAEQARRLHRLAEADPLTGVLNRRSFHEHFEREWSRAERHPRPLSCIMLDVDFFKKINDTHGHAAGDAVLRHIAAVLTEACRPSDRVCRYGGEEFCIMVPETDEAGAAALAERIRIMLVTSPVELGDQLGQTCLTITASFGVAERLGDDDDVESIIERADQALHIAKHSGRNRVMMYHASDMHAEIAMIGNPARILSELTVGELVTPTPCIDCDDTIANAVTCLLENDIGSAPVVSSQGKLVGFISERDLMVLQVTPDSWQRPVGEVMKRNVVTYEANVSAQQVYQFLCRVSLHRVVVVQDGRPLGIISPSSLLVALRDRMENEAPAAL